MKLQSNIIVHQRYTLKQHCMTLPRWLCYILHYFEYNLIQVRCARTDILVDSGWVAPVETPMMHLHEDARQDCRVRLGAGIQWLDVVVICFQEEQIYGDRVSHLQERFTFEEMK